MEGEYQQATWFNISTRHSQSPMVRDDLIGHRKQVNKTKDKKADQRGIVEYYRHKPSQM